MGLSTELQFIKPKDVKMKLFLALIAQIFAQEGQLSAGEQYATLSTLPTLSTSAADTGMITGLS